MTRLICAIAIILPLLAQTIYAQQRTSEKIKPRWMQKLPEPTNDSFQYELVTATATSLDAAREKTLTNLINTSGMKNGIVTVTNYKSKEELSQKWDNGQLKEEVNYNAQTNIKSESKEVKLYIEPIAEYWERDATGNYYLTRLYAKSELNKAPLFDNVEVTTKYGINGLWRSLIVPGWGQLYKGSTLKGCLILGSCVAAAASIIATEQQRVDYIQKIDLTHNVTAKRTYATRADNLATGRNICIGILSAIYVYNLIDALVAPGASHIIVHNRNREQEQIYSFCPTLLNYNTAGITASITF